ncbi:Uma2 family endonuclease [Anabaena sp. CCY 9402-a]|uniref:Uma2 family endonuclease n=1 Tax=Anabaena sp. CCY 9402-a TaxID=3103867 RepID=UPI0039C66343
MVTQLSATNPQAQLVITWEALPKDFQLEDEPVENTGQPILAGALRESLEISGFIQPQMLIASNFGLCATVNGQFIIKAPDWVYVPQVNEIISNRKSYTPILEGEIPLIVMEFLSDNDGGEYSVKRTYPPGRWFFYEQILQVPIYIIFDPDGGLLEYHQLERDRYELKLPDENGRHWVDAMGLYLGTWQGTKEAHTGYWLRWWDKDGRLLPWAVEKIEQEQQQKERLMAYLRSQGIDPNNLPPFDEKI